MKLERQPSNLIDSFAQTESRVDSAMVTGGSSSSDMVDSGVGSQHNKLTIKEQNPSTMEDDEDISLTDTEQQQQQQKEDDDDKKDDEVSDEISLKSF